MKNTSTITILLTNILLFSILSLASPFINKASSACNPSTTFCYWWQPEEEDDEWEYVRGEQIVITPDKD